MKVLENVSPAWKMAILGIYLKSQGSRSEENNHLTLHNVQ